MDLIKFLAILLLILFVMSLLSPIFFSHFINNNTNEQKNLVNKDKDNKIKPNSYFFENKYDTYFENQYDSYFDMHDEDYF